MENVIKMFNVMVVDDEKMLEQPCTACLKSVGVITNFIPSAKQKSFIDYYFEPLKIKTLFTVEQRDTASLYELLYTQVLHYIEVYGLKQPGLFSLEQDGGEAIKLNYIKGVSVSELADMVRKLMYSNMPIKDVAVLVSIVKDYKIDFEFEKIQNNEVRIQLFDPKVDKFNNGDDAVRYIVFKTTDDTMLIKSDEVINSVKSGNNSLPNTFFENNALVLSNVFNRHKKIIMACKNGKTKSTINKISKMSKQHHVPIKETFNKNFVSIAMAQGTENLDLSKLSIRDKFKILNLLEYKKMQNQMDAFIIRNGKIHIEELRPILDKDKVENIINFVLDGIKSDLEHLNDKSIYLDPIVSYGLPVSRKQSVGHLPYGSTVDIENGDISSGVYWHNDGGAYDLDLSTISIDGSRVGWGCMAGYTNSRIKYSGDITSAYDGAMEFMTSKDATYGLFVNIFSGTTGAEYELVVGNKSKNRWIENPIIREKGNLNSRGSVVGFVSGKKFIVYNGRISNKMVSSSQDMAILNRGLAKMWTINEVFDRIGVKYNTVKDDNPCDYDLSYESFSYDKLEEIFQI